MVKKTLSERIAERAKDGKKTTVGARNKAIFLTLKTDIEHALNDGWSILKIWETLYDEGKINFGYQAFRRNTNSLILAARTKEKDDKKPKKEGGASSFTFNSNANKKDLL